MAALKVQFAPVFLTFLALFCEESLADTHDLFPLLRSTIEEEQPNDIFFVGWTNKTFLKWHTLYGQYLSIPCILLEPRTLESLALLEESYPSLILAMATTETSTSDVLNLLSSTVLVKPLIVRTGLYDQRNKLVFLISDFVQKEMVYADPHFKGHGQANVLKALKNFYIESRFNPVSQRFQKDHFGRLKSEEKKGSFLPLLSMQGFYLRLGMLPFNTALIADKTNQPKSPRHLFTNHSGLIPDFLNAVADQYGLKTEILNPPDMLFGPILDGRYFLSPF